MRPLRDLLRADACRNSYRLTVLALSIYGAAAAVIIALVKIL